MVWRLARRLGLTGAVWNGGAGVSIEIWGEPAALDEFVQQLPLESPPLARITAIETAPLHKPAAADFRILDSLPGAIDTGAASDAATCRDCLAEVLDPANRRFRYPFTNCTHCGPRLSIIEAIPYDRAHTAMAAFPQCPACLAEYRDPADRRFHAQANTCRLCGPRLWLEDGAGREILEPGQDAIAITAALITQGFIIAIKGVGGFHLACGAGNERAVAELRRRKLRYQKPFAVMFRDIAMLKRYAALDGLEEELLSGPAAPIVLLPKSGQPLAASVAPDEERLGCLLPYTAMHHCLLRDLAAPIVLTSGNLSEEPPCLDNDRAKRQLAEIADYWLLHDREIITRLDDSVARVIAGKPRLLRRARGYAPQPLPLPPEFAAAPPVLALGGELKNTFCLLKNGEAIMSPHIGDLENAAVLEDYRRMLARFQEVFGFRPQALAVDLHEGYFSTQLGRRISEEQGLPLLAVQHHHAHIAACMAEHLLPLDGKPVLGVAMDGLGMGDDGLLWGGEFLRADYKSFSRLAAFQPLPLLGGGQAMRQPWRNTYAHLRRYFDWDSLNAEYGDLEIMQFLQSQPLHVYDAMLAKNLNSPPSSACGRCFDAFAAALGICPDAVGYEGQAAIGLENLAAPAFEEERGRGYGYDYLAGEALPLLSWRPFWLGLLGDLRQGVDKAVIAARIHHGLATAIAEAAARLADGISSEMVVLSGGVFQNRLLLEEVSRMLAAAGKTPLSPSLLPCNDGGLAFGQAVVATAKGW